MDDDNFDLNNCDIRNAPKNIIIELLETYKNHPALWQIKNKDVYNNKTAKTRGYAELLKVWKKFDPEADMQMVRTKVQSLRGSFRREWKKVERSLKSGCPPEEVYQPHLWYFGLMTFLFEEEAAHNEAQDTNSPGQIQDELYDDDIDLDESVKSSKTILNAVKKNFDVIVERKHQIEYSEHYGSSAKTFNTGSGPSAIIIQKNESEAFSQYIGVKLGNVTDPEQRMYAESLITKVVNKAIMNKLNRFSDLTDNGQSNF